MEKTSLSRQTQLLHEVPPKVTLVSQKERQLRQMVQNLSQKVRKQFIFETEQKKDLLSFLKRQNYERKQSEDDLIRQNSKFKRHLQSFEKLKVNENLKLMASMRRLRDRQSNSSTDALNSKQFNTTAPFNSQQMTLRSYTAENFPSQQLHTKSTLEIYARNPYSITKEKFRQGLSNTRPQIDLQEARY